MDFHQFVHVNKFHIDKLFIIKLWGLLDGLKRNFIGFSLQLEFDYVEDLVVWCQS